MTDEKYLIGLDLGTSAVKGVLMSAKGVVIAKEKARTSYITAKDGSIEFDAEEFYSLVAGVIQNLVKALPDGAAVAGLSMVTASGNTVLLDGADKPLMNAVSWMDTRARDESQTVFGELLNPAEIHQITGWPFINMFPIVHLSWLKCHQPEMLQQAAKICMSTDYVNFRLTGEWGIDSSTATTSYLQAQRKAEWYLPYLEKLGIPADKLPPIIDSGTVLGRITPEAAEKTGLPAGTPVVLGSFDHPGAARGSGVFDEGQLLLSCGTSWVGFYPLKDRDLAVSQNLLVDPFLRKEGLWGVMLSLKAISNYVEQYLRRYISDSPDKYKEFDRLAACAPIGANGLLINTMQFDERDELDQCLKADIARAVMEGTAYLLRMRIEQLQQAGMRVDTVNMVGGPSETHPWPQIIADVLGRRVTIVNGSCAGAVGAAVLAGIGVGLYANERAAYAGMNFEKRVLLPDSKAHAEYSYSYNQFAVRFPDTKFI